MGFWHRFVQPKPSPAYDALAADPDDIPRYPPFLKGLPPASPARLLQDQKELLDKIRLSSGVGERPWDKWYAPVITRYAAHVHLLPASQSHHHRGAGGLLRHGLEAAFQALRLLDTMLVGGGDTASARRAALPRWQYAAFLAGLLHDAAKPITDVSVTDRDGQMWSPFALSLADWLAGKERYFLHWRSGRRDKHLIMATLIAPRLIGTEGLAFLAGDDAGEILQLLAESLAGLEYGANALRDIATQADAWSVQKDVATLGTQSAPGESDLGVPVERYLLDALRRLCREGQFAVNRPGGMVWHLEDALYLVWPKAGAEAIAALKRDHMPGIPSDPDRVAQILIERGLAMAAANGPYHRLSPEAMRDPGGREVFVRALRLRDPALLIDPPPPVVPGRVDAGTGAGSTATDGAAPRSPASPLSPAPVAPPSQPVIAATPPPLPLSPPLKGAPQALGATSDERPPGLASSPVPGDPGAALRALGPLGEILLAIAEDLGRGARPAAFAWSVEDGLALRYPDAVTGYGIPAKDVLALLQAPDMIVVPDPITPAKRVRMLPMGDSETRAIVIRPDVAAWMQAIREGARAIPSAPAPVSPAPSEAPRDREAVLRALARASKAVKRKRGFAYIPLPEAVAALQSAWAIPPEEAASWLADLPSGQIDNQTYLKIPETDGVNG